MMRRQEGAFVGGTCDMPLFQMNVRAALPAIGGLNGFRLPLEVVAVGAPNLDPRFCSHSELLAVQFQTHLQSILLFKDSRLIRGTISAPRNGPLDPLMVIGGHIERRSNRIESSCLREAARRASLLCVLTSGVGYNNSGSTARISPRPDGESSAPIRGGLDRAASPRRPAF